MCSTTTKHTGQFLDILNRLNDNPQVKREETSDVKKRQVYHASNEIKKEKIFDDSELRKLLNEPIKQVIAKIKIREDGVVYVDFEDLNENNLNNQNSSKRTEHNKENEKQKQRDYVPSRRNSIDFIKQKSLIINSKDDNFENIWINETCIDLDSIDISDCLMVDIDLN